MTNERGKKSASHKGVGERTNLTRRQALAGGLGLAAGLVGAQAQAQEWWQQLPGFASFTDPGRDRRPRQQTPSDVLDDLRQGAVPLRSQEMLGAMGDAIERVERVVAEGGWPNIPGNRMIRPGDEDERIPMVRRVLVLWGDMRPQRGFSSFSLDGEMEAGIRRFQSRHGLRVSGRVDRPTLQALNVPPAARLAQLRMNYNRVRDLLSLKIDERYVLVNVPGFQAEAVWRHTVERRHRVIAGKPDRQTPVVTANIRALNFFPFWRVPESIANLDVIPRLAKEPDYLQKEHIRVLTGSFVGPEIDVSNVDWRSVDAKNLRFRQDPGPHNALGLVRIDMQNEHGVYMHDTPMKPLFQQRSRAFSAGCVRVQDVFQLVEWLAKYEPGWENPGQVQAVLDMGQALDVQLSRPVPVYFTYITAWAEPDGRIAFRPDIYRRDGSAAMAEVFDPDAPPPPAQGLAP
ncbi:MAG: L,D-transpeptidase family protein [Hyphomicrobium sp.]|nr:L,D-transpeptidase family protein [Hyphomicrobium sp.]